MEHVFFIFPTSQLEILIRKRVKKVINEKHNKSKEKLFGIGKDKVLTKLERITNDNKVAKKESLFQRENESLCFSCLKLTERITSGNHLINKEIKKVSQTNLEKKGGNNG
ncbi:hypothetical protein [Sphingobacterium sp.]|uniref:hypothetical protein n=1 Tax=Sphingobacterium sp. TaxID=341027 RepID=UPI0028A6CA84|nr:hypothetical protein [Sphingobacterium sp.]